MCGICGFLASAERIPETTLKTMNAQIRRRGPDGEGFYADERVGLAMRRLAIIDVHSGWQPIWNEDKTVCVVFNGEIYNYRKIRAALLDRGHKLQTKSDTETLVHLYEDYGDRLVDHLEGMFAFAIWDTRNQSLLLGRDRLGIKPLFIAETARGWLFGSEIKCLLATGFVSKEIDPEAVDQYFRYTSTCGEHTIFKQIRKILPGYTVRLRAGAAATYRQYWRVGHAAEPREPAPDLLVQTEKKLLEAVEAHMVSDVPVGAFLSGGVDSGLLVAMMAKFADKPVQTFTVGFRNAGADFIDERHYARMVVERYGLNHREVEVDPDFEAIADEIVQSFDEPFADDSVIPSYYVSQVAAQNVKVAVTGLGGDELFAGYRRHLGMQLAQKYATYQRWPGAALVRKIIESLPETLGKADTIDHLKRFVRSLGSDEAARYVDMLSTTPDAQRSHLYAADFRRSVRPELSAQHLLQSFDEYHDRPLLEKVLLTDQRAYLVDDILTLSDRLSMWHSLELRVPFLHHPFVEHCWSIDGAQKISGHTQKKLLKEIALRWLPRELIEHRKQGFESPMGQWLRGPLLGYFDSIVSETNVKRAGVLDYAEMRRLRDEHVSGRRKNSKLLFAALMFQLWHSAYA